MLTKGKSGSGKGVQPLGVAMLTRRFRAPKGGGNAVKVKQVLREKHNKCMEAMEKLKSGMRFNEVATQQREDTAGQEGTRIGWPKDP
jgi:NIMA-interacting peptidyl-prolyl cis-trans isomerase 4